MPRLPRQLSFLPSVKASSFGGGLKSKAQGKRKSLRPLDPKRPLHLILKSSHAQGPHSMLHPKHAPLIEKELRRLAYKWNIKLHRFANAGNHLHLLLSLRSRASYRAFLRELTGKLAMLLTGSRKSHPLEKGPFWDQIVWSRLVH